MQAFLAYYWMRQGDRDHGMLCERLMAASLDDALAQVEARLGHRTFTFVSDTRGRVLVVSAHVQYVEIEPADPDLSELPEGFHNSLPGGMAI